MSRGGERKNWGSIPLKRRRNFHFISAKTPHSTVRTLYRNALRRLCHVSSCLCVDGEVFDLSLPGLGPRRDLLLLLPSEADAHGGSGGGDKHHGPVHPRVKAWHTLAETETEAERENIASINQESTGTKTNVHMCDQSWPISLSENPQRRGQI